MLSMLLGQLVHRLSEKMKRRITKEFGLPIGESTCQQRDASSLALKRAEKLIRGGIDSLIHSRKWSVRQIGKALQRACDRLQAGKNPLAFTPIDLVRLTGAHMTRRSFSSLFSIFKKNSLERNLLRHMRSWEFTSKLNQIIEAENQFERRLLRALSLILSHAVATAAAHWHISKKKNRATDLSAFLDSFAIDHFIGGFLMKTENAELECEPSITPPPPSGKGWITDTLWEVNGVARTIRTMAEQAQKQGADLLVFLSSSKGAPTELPAKNVQPLVEFDLPEYPSQKLGIPCFVDLVETLHAHNIRNCIISTPGPLGLISWLAARMLGLEVAWIDHTDFPKYVSRLTRNAHLGELTESALHFLYQDAERVWVNSEFYKNHWTRLGIAPEKLFILPRGVDTHLFRSQKCAPDFWPLRSAHGFVLLYVGRVSREKELEFLARVFSELEKKEETVALAIVGDGPFLNELQALVPRAICTGPLHGEELAAAYASADLLLFPSTTDTFGNAVLESLACGTPAFVSNLGGPQELITSSTHGRILPAHDLNAWADAIRSYLHTPLKREERESLAASIQAERSWGKAFETFWRQLQFSAH